MSSRTRYFLIGSGLVVAVGLGVGIVAYYGGPWTPASAGRAEMAYVPAGVRAVGYANVRTIMDSPVRQRLQAAMPAGEGRNELLAQTGIDIEKDIDSVVAGLALEDNLGGAVVILRGRFDRARIEKLAADHGAVAEDYRGTTVLTGAANGPPGVAFLDSTLLALGGVSGLKAAIDAAANRSSVTGDAALMQAVDAIDDTGSAWFVGRTAALSDTADLPDVVRRNLAGIEWVGMSAAVDTGVRARVRAQAKDDQAATDLRGVINGAIAAVRMFAGQDASLAEVLKTLEATGQGRTVEVSFTAPASLVDLVMRRGDVLTPRTPADGR
jgi:hypothetical protein